jgi:tetratricopeptide (TPR) repeat protein
MDEFRRVGDLDPGFYKAYSGQGRVLSLTGQYDAAIEMFEKALSIAGEIPNIIAALGQTLALAGRRRQACERLERLTAMAQQRHLSSSCFAILHLGLGDVEKSLGWLEHACDQHELQMGGVHVHLVYDPLRAETRFQKILERIGFLQ